MVRALVAGVVVLEPLVRHEVGAVKSLDELVGDAHAEERLAALTASSALEYIPAFEAVVTDDEGLDGQGTGKRVVVLVVVAELAGRAYRGVDKWMDLAYMQTHSVCGGA